MLVVKIMLIKKISDSSIIKNNNLHPDIDLNGKNITNVGYIKVNQYPEIGIYLTPKVYVDNTIRNSIDESTSLRLDP